MKQDRREWTRQAVIDGIRRTRKWTEGWRSHYGSVFDVSKRALEGDYTPAELVTDAVALWANAASMIWGFGQDLDEGLDFEVDEVSESVGPRYIAVPKWMVGARKPDQVTPPGDVTDNDLTLENVVVRVEGPRLTVALVGLKVRQPVTEGDYRMRFGTEEILFSVKPTA